MALTFVKCKECETIIEIKDLDVPLTEEILEQADETNTIRGNDLCAVCAEKAIQPDDDTPEEESEEETPEETSEQESTEEEIPEGTEQEQEEQISEEDKEEPAEENSGENNNN